MNLSISTSQFLLYGLAISAGLVYFPYIFVAYARLTNDFDMSAPRAMFDRLPDYAKRATWAHQNSFESFMLFTAATLMVYTTEHSSEYTSLLVIGFLGSRFLYSVGYIADVPILRSLMWLVSMIAIASLMTRSFGF
ncbi:putative membrane protein [Synechococcus sp. PCC 7502]|nr:putative membrane protein [Synechococcus sp. PCC 7502]